MFDLSGPHICTHAYHSVRAAAAAASVSMAACAAVSCSPPQELTNPFPWRMRLLRCLTLWSITAGPGRGGVGSSEKLIQGQICRLRTVCPKQSCFDGELWCWANMKRRCEDPVQAWHMYDSSTRTTKTACYQGVPQLTRCCMSHVNPLSTSQARRVPAACRTLRPQAVLAQWCSSAHVL